MSTDDDLGVDLAVFHGRPPKEQYVEQTRELTAADLEALALPRTATPKSLMRIHASHHSLARCLSTGMKQQQAALITGYSQSRISSLLMDPAFLALIEDYKSELKGTFADMFERMNDLSLDCIELLQERIHERPQELTVPILLDIIKSFADRTGHGPGQEVHLKVQNSDLIDRPPRETFEDWQKRRQIELDPGPKAPTVPTSPDSLGDALGDLEIDLNALAPKGNG